MRTGTIIFLIGLGLIGYQAYKKLKAKGITLLPGNEPAPNVIPVEQQNDPSIIDQIINSSLVQNITDPVQNYITETLQPETQSESNVITTPSIPTTIYNDSEAFAWAKKYLVEAHINDGLFKKAGVHDAVWSTWSFWTTAGNYSKSPATANLVKKYSLSNWIALVNNILQNYYGGQFLGFGSELNRNNYLL